MQNPFTLTFGKSPLEPVERPLQTMEIVDTFTAETVNQQMFIITGVRGSGKTVMMTEIARRLREREEQIRLYRLMEKLNWFFHQEMHYLNRDIAEKTARECYPEIRDFTYDILWNDLPREVQGQLMNEDETL